MRSAGNFWRCSTALVVSAVADESTVSARKDVNALDAAVVAPVRRSSLDNRLAALALKLESGDRRWRSSHISLLLFLGFSGISTVLILGGHGSGEPLVLLLDLRESPHVLKEVLAALQGDQELGLLAALGALVLALTLARDRYGHRANRLELGVLVPTETNTLIVRCMQFCRISKCARQNRKKFPLDVEYAMMYSYGQ